MILSKARLAITLSQLKTFVDPKSDDEQYVMDSEIGAEVLWQAYMQGDIENRRIVDLGAGTGLLGIGCLLLGAASVLFVEQDPKAVEVLQDNLRSLNTVGNMHAEVHCGDIQSITQKFDTVVQNPPFGTRSKHADRAFLEKAFQLAPTVYSFHKATSEDFLQKFSADQGFQIVGKWLFDFPIKMSQLFHKKVIHRVKVGCWKFAKQPPSPDAQTQPT